MIINGLKYVICNSQVNDCFFILIVIRKSLTIIRGNTRIKTKSNNIDLPIQRQDSYGLFGERTELYHRLIMKLAQICTLSHRESSYAVPKRNRWHCGRFFD